MRNLQVSVQNSADNTDIIKDKMNAYLELKTIKVCVVNILDTKVGQQFLIENEIYQNFTMEKYLKLNHKSSRFGRTLKRKKYDDMVKYIIRVRKIRNL